MIKESEYKKRRESLSSSLKKNSITLLFSAEIKNRSNDTEYPYRQNSNFYYLTGFKEDSSALMIVKTDKETYTYLLISKKDKKLELWNGKRYGIKKAKKNFTFDNVFEYQNLLTIFQKNSTSKTKLYYDFSTLDHIIKPFKQVAKQCDSYTNISKKIQLLRLRKSKSEINLIKNAINITKMAHHRAMKSSYSLNNEYELQAEIEYIFKKNNAYSDAYSSIVACGNAANTLHYITNNKPLKKGSLILIDAGCEYKYYASDITRTIPVNGKFTQAQRELYQLVLNVEKEIIKMIKPGVLRSDLHKKSEELLCQGMVKFSILKGDVKKLLKHKAHKKYYPHGIGHWMGLDVHDEAPYIDTKGDEIPLLPGMVLTIEPGIYIDKDDQSVPNKYRGIGIRIEDNILVTKDSYENLSYAIVKEIGDIEALSF